MSKFIPLSAQRALKTLGLNVQTARKKRRLRIRDVAEYTKLSELTIRRIEKGEAGVSLGSFLSVLHVLGELPRIVEATDIKNDRTGLIMDTASLPQRIRKGNRQ